MKRNRIRQTFFIVIFLSILPYVLFSQNKLIVYEQKKNAIITEIFGLKAIDYIYSLCTFERSGASKGLYDSQMWVHDRLLDWGIKDVKMLSFPADGEHIYLDMNKAGYAWEKNSAVLYLIEPYKKKLIDFAEIPTALIKYSNSADITAEVVDIGGGLSEKDYTGKDVKGKIVFTSSPSYQVINMAVKKHGAAGIISYWENYEPERSRYPDQVAWMAIPQELDTNTFGFSVSRNIKDELKNLLAKGKVVVNAKVDSENKKGNYYVLSSSIQGKELPEKEIFLMAHINHHKPGANDNASGSALIMEIERATKNLIESGKISQPKRTLRFLWMGEHTGSKIYVDSRPEISRDGIIALNLDMVGEDILQCESSVRLTLTPNSCSSFLNDLVNNIMEYVSRSNFVEFRGNRIPFTYTLEKYNGGISDHYWYVSGGISVPSSFIYLWPDNYYHSNEDTPDKCDPTILKRIGFIMMATALYVASAGEDEAIDLSRLVLTEGSKRIIQTANECVDYMLSATVNELNAGYKEAVNKLEQIYQTEVDAIKSVYKLSDTKRVIASVEDDISTLTKIKKVQRNYLEQRYFQLCGQSGQKRRKIALNSEEKKYDKIIPQRHFRGPLKINFIQTKISTDRSEWYDEANSRIPDFFLVKDEIANYINNKNSILDIRNKVSAEFGPIALIDVFHFIEGIREAGFVTYIER